MWLYCLSIQTHTDTNLTFPYYGRSSSYDNHLVGSKSSCYIASFLVSYFLVMVKMFALICIVVIFANGLKPFKQTLVVRLHMKQGSSQHRSFINMLTDFSYYLVRYKAPGLEKIAPRGQIVYLYGKRFYYFSGKNFATLYLYESVYTQNKMNTDLNWIFHKMAKYQHTCRIISWTYLTGLESCVLLGQSWIIIWTNLVASSAW